MSTASTSGRINTILFGLFVVVALLFIWFWISNPTRSVGETSGTVEAITVQRSTDGHIGPDRTAMIRLADGTLEPSRRERVGWLDVVFLQNGQVVDCIARGSGHAYAGQSSSPPDRVPTPTRTTPPDSTTGAVTGAHIRP